MQVTSYFGRCVYEYLRLADLAEFDTYKLSAAVLRCVMIRVDQLVMTSE